MKKILFSLLGIALFLYIVLSIGIEAIAESFLTLNPLLFTAALLLLVPSIFLKGFKQRMLVSPFKQHTSLLANTKIWLISFFFGVASPAKSGEAARALYLRNFFGVSLGQGLAVVFMERVLDMLLLFVLAFFGLLFLTAPTNNNLVLLSLAVFFIAFVAVVFLALRKDFVKFFVRPFFNRFAPKRFRQGLKSGFNEFYQAIFSYTKNRSLLASISLVTLFSWLFIFFQFYLLALALSIDISFLSFVFVFPAIVLVEAVPVTVSGIGTRDAASIVMFGLLGIAAATAVSFSLTILVFNLISAAAGFMLFNSSEKPI